MKHIEIKSSRVKYVLVAAMGFVAGGIFILVTGGPAWVGWMGIVFFSAGMGAKATALQGALLSTLVGVPFGVAASFAAWYIVFRGFVPKFTFSGQLNKVPGLAPGEPPRYRVKFINVGRRDAIDVDVYSRLRVRNLSHRPEYLDTWTIVTLSSDTTHEPKVPKGGSRMVVLGLDETAELATSKFQRALDGRVPTLENLLSLGKEAEIVVWVLAYDEFSGARKGFISKHYSLDDIREGQFGGRSGLDIIPLDVHGGPSPATASRLER